MTLEQLRVFIAVAERGHVTEGARALNLAQSAASHAIAALEARHDVRLFDRIGRRIALTEAGVALLAEARRILAEVEHAERTLAEFGALERGVLSLHASQTIAGYWLPPRLVAFQRAYPRIEIKLTIGNTAEVAQAVENGAAELGFVEGAVKSESLESLVVARDQLVLVVGPDHPWGDAKSLKPADLLQGEWVLREVGSGTRSAFEQALRRLGVRSDKLRIAMELPSNEAVRAAVETGLGATATSASVAASSLEAGLLRQVRLKLPDREFHVLSQRNRSRSRVATALFSILAARSR
ncbi:MAG TPA: LysR substrate-binding domain-containing protein [Roseiarcus sp.]